MSEDELAFASAYIPESGVPIVHYERCESCMWGSHFDGPRWHSWAGPEDVEHAEATGQDVDAIKRQRCACECAGSLNHTKEGSR